ncbi:MAG: AmmeMemoRadiSam system protein B [Verrucomicrobia bacterium]|nr:AmmeMemoRadiSam system protein B [Verrucomicrobiota bacterium]
MEGRGDLPAEGLTPNPTQLTARCAGSCYPADPRAALVYFQSALEKVRPSKSGPKDHRRPIVPHIDFRVNFDLYAETYALWRDRNWFPSRVVILGVGHRCPSELACLPAGFQTPLGEVKADTDLFAKIGSHYPFPIGRESRGFQGEHSIEFVVIWLQAIRDLFFPGKSFTILPILCGGFQAAVEAGSPPPADSPETLFAHALAQASDDTENAWVASIDGCHVGPRFQHPFSADSGRLPPVKRWTPFSGIFPSIKTASTSTGSVSFTPCSQAKTSGP